MAGDRDLAVAVVRALPPGPSGGRTGWEMTAATGVRGLRLLAESGAFSRFTFTEANPEAFRVLRENVARFSNATALPGDSRAAPDGSPFDYVDLDPYGSPAPFVETAVRTVGLGGVLAVTATDMMVLAGAQPSACGRRYGARPVRGRLGPEGGLRILLAYLARSAESAGRSVRPLLGYARDHYVRAYLEVQGPATSPSPIGAIDPRTWTGPWVGDQGPYGPLWLGPLFDPEIVGRLAPPEGAARPDETARFVRRLQEEVGADFPFYFEANVLASRLGLAEPPGLEAVLRGLRSAGYRAARTHARPEGFRTDAPRTEVEELVRDLAEAGQSQKTRVRA